MIRINLLPDVILKQRQEERLKRLAMYGAIGWVVLLVVVSLLVFAYKGWHSIRLNRAKTTLAQVDARVNSPENVAFRTEAQAVQESLNALDELFLAQQRPSEFIKNLAALTPQGVRLTNVRLESDSVSITGRATSYAEVSKFVAALKKSAADAAEAEEEQPYFELVELVGANLADANQVSFELSAVYVEAATNLATSTGNTQ